MWMMSYPGSYLPLFNASARALKDVSPYVAMQLQGFTIFHGYTPAQQPSTVALAAAHRYSYTHSLASTELQVDARCVPREHKAVESLRRCEQLIPRREGSHVWELQCCFSTAKVLLVDHRDHFEAWIDDAVLQVKAVANAAKPSDRCAEWRRHG